MAVSARRDTAGPAPDDDPERKPDPRASGWADVRHALITGVHAWRLAVGELARDPGSTAALEMVRLTGGIVESLGVIAGRWVVDEALLDAERERGYAAGAADCKAARCRLAVVDGGAAG